MGCTSSSSLGCASSSSLGSSRGGSLGGSPGLLAEFYDVEKSAKLGEGMDGSVYRGTSKVTGTECALKTIPKKRVNVSGRQWEEVEIMEMMDHPNIIKLHETFHDRKNTYIVMELCDGGRLSNMIQGMGSFPECEAEIGMQQLLSAVHYMHSKYVCHRDLKPDNILLSNFRTFETNTLKIIDFGISTTFEEGQVLTTMAGSPHYIAPQVIEGKYNNLCDLWSCGAILFTMLCGSAPFQGDTDEDVMQQVLVGRYAFDAPAWADVTAVARNLIQMLLIMKPTERYTAERAMQHEWIKVKPPQAAGTLLTSPRRASTKKQEF